MQFLKEEEEEETLSFCYYLITLNHSFHSLSFCRGIICSIALKLNNCLFISMPCKYLSAAYNNYSSIHCPGKYLFSSSFYIHVCCVASFLPSLPFHHFYFLIFDTSIFVVVVFSKKEAYTPLAFYLEKNSNNEFYDIVCTNGEINDFQAEKKKKNNKSE